jgi:hypothetical protein
VVIDAAKRADLAALYKRAYMEVYSPQRQAEVSQLDPRLIESATYLAEHMHEVPVLIIPCVEAPSVQGTGPGAGEWTMEGIWWDSSGLRRVYSILLSPQVSAHCCCPSLRILVVYVCS